MDPPQTVSEKTRRAAYFPSIVAAIHVDILYQRSVLFGLGFFLPSYVF